MRVARRRFLAGLGAPLAVAQLRPVAAQETTIRVSTTAAASFALPWLAQDLGLYKRAGFTADITQFGGGEVTIAAVASGNADLGVTTPVQLASAYAHDVPVRLIGFVAQYGSSEPSPALFVARESTLHSAKDLIGKTVGVNAVKATNFLGVQVWLDQNGVDPDTVRAVEVPFPQIAAALKRGTIDAGVLAEPFIRAAKDDIRLLSPAFDSLGPHWAISVWFGRLDYLKANAALVRRFVDAGYQTAKLVNAHPDQGNPILAKYTKLPVETINAMPQMFYFESPDPSSCRIELAMAYKFKILPKPVTVGEVMSLR